MEQIEVIEISSDEESVQSNERDRASNLFFITVPQTDVPKQYAFDWFKQFCDAVCVAQEKHHDNNWHHHIFIRTLDKLHFEDVQEWIQSVYEKHGNIQHCRNERNTLRYITKEDISPLYTETIQTSHFNFAWHARVWARETPTFSYSDPFVLNHPQYYRLLSEVHNAVQQEQSIESALQATEDIPCGQWQGEVRNWYNDWIENGWYHKKKQLYLWGKSNAGKTTLINQLIRDQHDLVFRPTPEAGKFAWQEFNHQRHKIVIMDEYSQSDFSTPQLKLAAAGEHFVTDVKGTRPRRIRVELPMVIISNDPPPTTTGFQERFLIVEV